MIRPLSLVFIALISLSASAGSLSVFRDDHHFPRCVQNIEGKNLFFKFSRKTLTRVVRYKFSERHCETWRMPYLTGWKIADDNFKSKLPDDLAFEIEQIEKKANEFRTEKTAAEYIDAHNITTFTRELNRELTPKYGPIFSAEVFREITERKPGNKEFRKYVLDSIRSEEDILIKNKEKVKLVVSFGLGWSHKYGIAAPSYIKDFLADIESLGLEVVYLDKNPFGRVDANVQRIIPQLESELRKDKSVVFLSLCKGTPELFSALSEIQEPELRKKIIGHVNLSGMLTGTFFADITMSVILPKIMSPFLRVLPINSMKTAGKMINSAAYMRTSVISETLAKVEGKLPENVLTVNVTGAPMSDYVMKSGSPMAPIMKYNYWQKFLVSANDGFIELPHTVVPEELASRQVTLVLDSSHMLSDGRLEEFSLSEKEVRRRLYQSILGFILNR
jgi:hypothetical protein